MRYCPTSGHFYISHTPRTFCIKCIWWSWIQHSMLSGNCKKLITANSNLPPGKIRTIPYPRMVCSHVGLSSTSFNIIYFLFFSGDDIWHILKHLLHFHLLKSYSQILRLNLFTLKCQPFELKRKLSISALSYITSLFLRFLWTSEVSSDETMQRDSCCRVWGR